MLLERTLTVRTGPRILVLALVAVRSGVDVEMRFCVWLRELVPSRTAAPACATDIAIAIIKIRILFISDWIVSKIAILEQAKYGAFI